MVWNTDDTAFEDGLAISRAYFASHGHLAAPKPAAINGYPVGQFLANCRRPLETRRNPERWRERWARLAAIDPDWNPTGRDDPAKRWPLDWQRMHAAVRLHVEAGGRIDDLVPGHTVGGEDVGAWLQRQRRSAGSLTPAQRAALAGGCRCHRADRAARCGGVGGEGGPVDAHPRRGGRVPGAGGASDGAAQARRDRRTRRRGTPGQTRRRPRQRTTTTRHLCAGPARRALRTRHALDGSSGIGVGWGVVSRSVGARGDPDRGRFAWSDRRGVVSLPPNG